MFNSGSACEADAWVSSSSIKSLSPQGVSATHAATVSLATIRQTGTDILSYDTPSILSPTYSYYLFALVGMGRNPFVVDGDPNSPILGQSSLLLIAANGLNFGTFDYSPGRYVCGAYVNLYVCGDCIHLHVCGAYMHLYVCGVFASVCMWCLYAYFPICICVYVVQVFI